MSTTKLLSLIVMLAILSKVGLTAETEFNPFAYTINDKIYTFKQTIKTGELGGRVGRITIYNQDNMQIGYADFEVGYINPLFDCLEKDDQGKLETFYINMVNTQMTPPGFGKLLVAHLAKLANKFNMPITLSSA